MKRIISVLLTIIILTVIFVNINLQKFADTIININLLYFSIYIFFLVPITILATYRWKFLMKYDCKMSFSQTMSHLLACASFNIILPSKMGDFGRGYFGKKDGKISLSRGSSGVIFEKSTDFLSIILFSFLGLIVTGLYSKMDVFIFIFSVIVLIAISCFYLIDLRKIKMFRWMFRLEIRKKKIGLLIEDVFEYVSILKKRKKFFAGAIFLSLLIWFLNFVQIYFLFLALTLTLDFGLIVGLVPIAIIIGLIPITVSGIGTRDSALIFLFSKYVPIQTMFAIGILITLRYWIPGIVGLPFFRKEMAK